MNNFCPHCGTKIKPNAKYCNYCGNKIHKTNLKLFLKKYNLAIMIMLVVSIPLILAGSIHFYEEYTIQNFSNETIIEKHMDLNNTMGYIITDKHTFFTRNLTLYAKLKENESISGIYYSDYYPNYKLKEITST